MAEFRWPTRRAVLLAPVYLGYAALSVSAVSAQTWTDVPGGLEARIPDGYLTTSDDRWLHIVQSAAVRAPLIAQLGIDATFVLHVPEMVRRTGDIDYTLRTLGGSGSGGPVHELRALRQLVDGARVALQAERQAEFTPDFDIAFDLLRSVRRQS